MEHNSTFLAVTCIESGLIELTAMQDALHQQQLRLDRMQSGSLASVRPQYYGQQQPQHEHHRPHRPEAIVSLIPSGTEILYALGLGHRCAKTCKTGFVH